MLVRCWCDAGAMLVYGRQWFRLGWSGCPGQPGPAGQAVKQASRSIRSLLSGVVKPELPVKPVVIVGLDWQPSRFVPWLGRAFRHRVGHTCITQHIEPVDDQDAPEAISESIPAKRRLGPAWRSRTGSVAWTAAWALTNQLGRKRPGGPATGVTAV